MNMQLTRQGGGFIVTGVVLALLALVFEQPRLLIGAVGLGAWLLTRQYLFVQSVSKTVDDLSIEQNLTQDRIVAERETTATLSLSLPSPSKLDIVAELVPPRSASGTTREERTAHLERGDSRASTVVTVEWPVAGSYEFAAPELTLTDSLGLFGESLSRGPTPTMVVEPRGPTNVHVGEGGDQLMIAYGERQSGRRDTGLDPGELREYVPGDAAGRIDWKATARMSEPYVREYEVETDRVTALVVDHRATMNEGPTGETKLDYARQVALTFVDSVREFNDPLGYYTVGDGGTTERRQPANQYALIKRRLRDLQPTGTNGNDSAEGHEIASPGAARHVASQLDGTSAFETTLRPYFATATTYVERIEDDPLFETARAMHARLSGTVWTVLFTDDTHRTEVRETVKLARRSGGSRVLVFLTPTVLFEPGGLADLETAYERYRSFESFRREIARLEGVSAFEVGPGDRLDAVLSSGRRQRPSAST